MPYSLVVDGELRELDDLRYLLSPQDLAAYDALPELVAAGVHGFKIEGRYKNAAYVSSAVDAVRGVRDAALRGELASAPGEGSVQLKGGLADMVRRTQLTFSRGASAGFLRGDDHQALVVGTSPKHRGLPLGTVRDVRGTRARVAVDARADTGMRDWLRAGMGVLFEVGDPEDDDAPGGPIFALRWLDDGELELSFGQPGPDLACVRPGVAVRVTGDPELAREAQRRVSADPIGRIALSLRASGRAGEPLRVQARAQLFERELLVSAQTTTHLQPARASGLDATLLQEKLGALGGTPFQIASLDVDALEPRLHAPLSELKPLRRELVAALELQLSAVPRGRVAVTVHHHIATFHNSHCVYAHLLSDGKDYRSCGRPCESHRVALRDFAGHDHPVVVDVGCRNTVFNPFAQSAASLVPDLLARGVRRLRVEFVWEGAADVTRTLRAYRELLAGKTAPAAALRAIGVHEQYGITRLRGARV
jgi:putative protease